MKIVLFIVVFMVWAYILYALKRADLPAWHFVWGSLGTFTIAMIWIRPYVTIPLARCVAALAGVVGCVTHAYEAFFKYGIIYVTTATGSMTLQIDFECSGVIEILAFFCILMFFEVYSRNEKIIVGIVGFAYIMLCNAVRIALICTTVHFMGIESYQIVHTYIARIVFYVMSVALYFYVFTKPQIIKMRVGNFTYGHSKSTN